MAWSCALAAALGRGDSHRPAEVVVVVSVQHDVYTDSRENNGLARRACGAAAPPSGVTMSETLSRPLVQSHTCHGSSSQCDTRMPVFSCVPQAWHLVPVLALRTSGMEADRGSCALLCRPACHSCCPNIHSRWNFSGTSPPEWQQICFCGSVSPSRRFPLSSGNRLHVRSAERVPTRAGSG